MPEILTTNLGSRHLRAGKKETKSTTHRAAPAREVFHAGVKVLLVPL